jgi:kinesin family protein 5
LKESLGGNSKTTLICACSQKLIHEDETINTLKFAQRAKRIKNRVCSNVKVNLQKQTKKTHLKIKKYLEKR